MLPSHLFLSWCFHPQGRKACFSFVQVYIHKSCLPRPAIFELSSSLAFVIRGRRISHTCCLWNPQSRQNVLPNTEPNDQLPRRLTATDQHVSSISTPIPNAITGGRSRTYEPPTGLLLQQQRETRVWIPPIPTTTTHSSTAAAKFWQSTTTTNATTVDAHVQFITDSLSDGDTVGESAAGSCARGLSRVRREGVDEDGICYWRHYAVSEHACTPFPSLPFLSSASRHPFGRHWIFVYIYWEGDLENKCVNYCCCWG